MLKAIEDELHRNYFELLEIATEYVRRVLCKGDKFDRSADYKVERAADGYEVQLLARFRIPEGMLKDFSRRSK